MTDVSVIVLDIDGGDMLRACLDSIASQTLPPKEVIVFDNGSRTPVAERIAFRPGLQLFRSDTNLGFAGGNNEAYRHATGSYIALVNNDVVLDRDWLATVAAALDADPRLAAVQTIIRRDDTTIDGAGIDISDGTFRQIGHAAGVGSRESGVKTTSLVPTPDTRHPTPAWGVSATAALYRRDALGNTIFDEQFFAYYEDADLCARLHEAGWRTEVLPVIKATHRGSQSAPLLGNDALRLRTRNRYFVARRHRGVGRISALLWEDVKLLARGRSSLRGIVEGMTTFVHAKARRPRRVGELRVFASSRDTASRDMNIVVHTPDVVGERMAGPGIRAWHLAGELAKHFTVTLICKREGELPSAASFSVAARGSAEASVRLRDAEVLIGQPARGFRRQRRGQRIVYDLFDPVLLELHEMYGRHPSMRQRIHIEAERWRVRRAVATGDLLVVATRKQRELYGGAQGPIIEVPFGVEDFGAAAPEKRENIVLWGGGTWEWLDPATAVEAIIDVNRRGIDCRLLFLGRSRPNQHTVDRRREDRLDEWIAAGGAFVEANDSWMPYNSRFSWLRRSKVAIMLHRPTGEAAYSIRTRLFDAIAAAVPVITTEEGFAAELVAAEELGIVVPPSNAPAVADAIAKLMTDDAFYARCVSNLIRIQPRFGWAAVTKPLIEAVKQWQTQREK